MPFVRSMIVCWLVLVAGCVVDPTAAPTHGASRTTLQTRAPSQIRPSTPFANAPPDRVDSRSDPIPGSVNARSFEDPARPGHPWTTTAKPRAWRYIVIHHSATESGNARLFDRAHRSRGWDELGYHFVIDNGLGGPDGMVEVGPRWRSQKHGAHAKTADDRFNNFGIGICLVGNFETGRPTARQMQALGELVAFLQARYNIAPSHVVGHRDTKPTACPGRHLPIAAVRQAAGTRLASSWVGTPQAPETHGMAWSQTELLRSH
jgi:hypothetical protein